MADKKTKFPVDRRQIAVAFFIVLALYILLPQVSIFHNSWQILGGLRPEWALIAIVLTLTTYIFAALTYCLLALIRLRYREEVVIQFAAMLFNRLLPAGVGALGANYTYLRHRRYNRIQAGTVVAINNFIGVVGHVLVVLVALLLASDYSRHLAAMSASRDKTATWTIVGGVVLLLVLALIFIRSHLLKTYRKILLQLRNYEQHQLRLVGALLSSVGLSLCNILCLYACMLAIGVHLPFIIVVLVFTFGVSTGTVTPTPGGLGGFEAGLTAGFVAYHVGSASALAIALLFRLISYWLMLLFGLSAFVISQKQHLFSDA